MQPFFNFIIFRIEFLNFCKKCLLQHADFEKSGALDIDEFMVAMYLADEASNGHPVPDQV